MNTLEILDRLIAFPTVSRDPNRALIDWVVALLAEHGIASTLIPDASGHKANLYATIGPVDRPGVMLSGHTDVVPVDGQDWAKPPFELTQADGKVFGRGTADMKGFCAAAIKAAIMASKRDLKTPLHLALSYDEEIGCIGVRSLVDMLAAAPLRPMMCIVGEPTGMQVASGHKGKVALRATCKGEEGHSALAPLAMNALHLAIDFGNAVRAKQAAIAATGHKDHDYDVPYTTLHLGKIAGGESLNIVPNLATVDFEIRNLAEDDPQAIIAELTAEAAKIVSNANHKSAAIEITETFSYPGLLTPQNADVMAFVRALTGSNGSIKVAFGTEGGLFNAKLGIPTVVCGPGSMMQGHKPDEFVSLEQLAACDTMMSNLVRRLEGEI
ncbi:MAG: acetylornithine deacetylase [Proteobacteria bacterium]|nr:acetylornithine deacetylase [Pseudomonadota bacterium]MDA1287046.1 acetylornithine deacetylase [Pseudomonadota bacterium]